MAKPKIDLADPAIAATIKAYREKALLALKLAAPKEDAVRPIYALNARTQSVEQVGSCVLLKVQGKFFALSASHVFDQVKEYSLLFGHGDRLQSLVGERFSSKKGPSGSHQDDPIDASVYHITSSVADNISASFLTLQDLDIMPADQSSDFHVVAGYRVSQSKSSSKGHSTKLDLYPSIEVAHDHYEHRKFSRRTHLLLSFEDQVLVDGRWQTSPSIRGVSGGAIFRTPNLSPIAFDMNLEYGKIKLAAVLIEKRKKSGDFLSAAVGTRLGFYFGLIDKYLPELHFKEMLIAEHQRQIKMPT